MQLPPTVHPYSPGKRRDTADLQMIENNQRINAHDQRAPLGLDLDCASDSEYTYQDEPTEKLLQPEPIKSSFHNQKASMPNQIKQVVLNAPKPSQIKAKKKVSAVQISTQ